MTSTVRAGAARRIGNRAALIEIIGGYMAARSLAVAAELKIADLVAAGRATGAELAEDTGTHPPSMHRLLRVLVAVGLLTETAPGRFALTEVGAQLRTDAPDSLWAFTRFFTDESLFAAWERLGHSLATGGCAFDAVHGTDVYSHLAANPELSQLFNVAMGQESRIAAELVAESFDYSAVRTVVDVGGGDGTLLAAILTAHPHLRGVCFDSAAGVAEAPGVLAAAGVSDRCEVVAGDFFTSVPDGGDLYIVKSVLQDWDDEHARRMLRTVRAHLPAGATLLLVGSVMPDVANRTNPVMYYTDLNMLVTAGGRERTEAEFRALLTAAGFAAVYCAHGAAGPLSLIKAVPV